ncbi:MAG: AAA-like domain-containing protein [Deltaproteobacteria bacterium]|jgi:hypothetical protein|nr:AAA-like domain-containing protein [Deltaproteobacteria bacterium]
MESHSSKWFNVAGPCAPEKHYMLPVLPRLPGVDTLIDKENYFIVHAPRQSGKTTFLQELTKKINSEGQYYAFYCSLDSTQNMVDDDKAITRVAEQINRAIKISDISDLVKLAYPDDSLPNPGTSVKISNFLNYLCLNLDKNLIVFFDEADCLSGPPLITFLRQIRQGYIDRSYSSASKFPRSLALVGLRDIRDSIASNHPEVAGAGLASPFNVAAERMTLANFTEREIGALYRQHTYATGQVFEEQAIAKAWYWSQGQPWLVNALADIVIAKQLNNDYSVTITKDHLDQAAEILIQRRDTHIDYLLERLKEQRVINVMEPIFIGDDYWDDKVTDDDISYAIDLGLIKQINEISLPANPIYSEAIIRTLTQRLQKRLPLELANRWLDSRSLDVTGLLKGFQQFWRQNAEILGSPYNYKESTPHLVCFAFLQRVLNGAVEAFNREYALGRRRLDIEVKYKGVSYPIELKIKRKG